MGGAAATPAGGIRVAAPVVLKLQRGLPILALATTNGTCQRSPVASSVMLAWPSVILPHPLP